MKKFHPQNLGYFTFTLVLPLNQTVDNIKNAYTTVCYLSYAQCAGSNASYNHPIFIDHSFI